MNELDLNLFIDQYFHMLQTHGIHQHFGVYYALGIGLAFEGVMGSFYHVCPNNSNFQFGEWSNCFSYCIPEISLDRIFTKPSYPCIAKIFSGKKFHQRGKGHHNIL